MPAKLNLRKIFSKLDSSSIIVKREVLIADEITERSIYKIRCQLLLSKYQFEIRFIQTDSQINKKFGSLPPKIEERIKAIKDFNKLSKIGTDLLDISDIKELKSSLR